MHRRKGPRTLKQTDFCVLAASQLLRHELDVQDCGTRLLGWERVNVLITGESPDVGCCVATLYMERFEPKLTNAQ